MSYSFLVCLVSELLGGGGLVLHGPPLVDGCSTAVVPSSMMKYLPGLWDGVFCKYLFQDVICPALLGADSWGWAHYRTLRLLRLLTVIVISCRLLLHLSSQVLPLNSSSCCIICIVIGVSIATAETRFLNFCK